MRTFTLLLSLALVVPGPAHAGVPAAPPPDRAQIERALDFLVARRVEFKPDPLRRGPVWAGFAIWGTGVALMLLPVATDRFLAARFARGARLPDAVIDLDATARMLGPTLGPLLFLSGGAVTAVTLPFALYQTPRDDFNAKVLAFLNLSRAEQVRRLNDDPALAARFVGMARSIARAETVANAARGYTPH